MDVNSLHRAALLDVSQNEKQIMKSRYLFRTERHRFLRVGFFLWGSARRVPTDSKTSAAPW